MFKAISIFSKLNQLNEIPENALDSMPNRSSYCGSSYQSLATLPSHSGDVYEVADMTIR